MEVAIFKNLKDGVNEITTKLASIKEKLNNTENKVSSISNYYTFLGSNNLWGYEQFIEPTAKAFRTDGNTFTFAINDARYIAYSSIQIGVSSFRDATVRNNTSSDIYINKVYLRSYIRNGDDLIAGPIYGTNSGLPVGAIIPANSIKKSFTNMTSASYRPLTMYTGPYYSENNRLTVSDTTKYTYMPYTFDSDWFYFTVEFYAYTDKDGNSIPLENLSIVDATASLMAYRNGILAA